MLVVNLVTLFPEVLQPFLAASIPGRAAKAKLVEYRLVQLRDFTHDRHNTVDDYAYGGGAGMVMKPEPFVEAVESLGSPGPVLLLSARGRTFRHADAVRLSLESRFTILCGHYKDVDQRVVDLSHAAWPLVTDRPLSAGLVRLRVILREPVLTASLNDRDWAVRTWHSLRHGS